VDATERKGTTMPTSSVRIETRSATRYLEELCRRLSETIEARPEAQARIEWSEIDGTVDFGWGRCVAAADDSTLNLQVDADDDAALEAIEEIFTRHIEHVDADNRLTVDWQRAGTPATAPGVPERRARMREFHRRVRHTTDHG